MNEISATTTQTASIITNQVFQSNIITVAFLAIGILPSAVYSFPESSYEKGGNKPLSLTYYPVQSDELNQKQVLEDFAHKLLSNLVETDPDIIAITNKRFLDMYEDF